MFLDKVGIGNIIDAFRSSETSSKTQQILLWIMLMQCEFNPKSKVTKALLEDNVLFVAVLGLLDSNVSIVKGRV